MSSRPKAWFRRDDTPLWQRYQERLEALREAQVNFDLDRQHEYTQQNGWHIDNYEAELIDEPPGPPLPDGPWAIGCQMLREYRFPDPSIVTGIFLPDTPLEQRVMLLRARAYFMTFFFGVRVANIRDTTIDGEHGQERVWGYSYQTLRGHYEQGQMDFAIIKRLATGEVLFQIHAFSKAGRIPNPIIRIGFHLLGRRIQVRFAKRALARMQNLIQEELQRRAGTAPQQTTETPPVQPASAAPAQEQHKAAGNT